MTASIYENHLDAKEPRWFAVYTRYKREKLVARRLAENGIEVYLPLQKFTRRWTRKVREVELPLINCHLFVKITQKEYVRVLQTLDVVHFVKIAQNLLAIPEFEIEILKKVVGEKIEVEIEATGLVPGQVVEIIGGQLTGIKGKLIEQTNDKNFLIELNNLGYSLRMQVDAKFLYPLTVAV